MLLTSTPELRRTHDSFRPQIRANQYSGRREEQSMSQPIFVPCQSKETPSESRTFTVSCESPLPTELIVCHLSLFLSNSFFRSATAIKKPQTHSRRLPSPRTNYNTLGTPTRLQTQEVAKHNSARMFLSI